MARGFGLDASQRTFSVDVTSCRCAPSRSCGRARETSLLFVEEDGQRRPADCLEFRLGVQIKDLTPNSCGHCNPKRWPLKSLLNGEHLSQRVFLGLHAEEGIVPLLGRHTGGNDAVGDEAARCRRVR